MYGLKHINEKAEKEHAIVILHGIRQTRDDLADPFGQALIEYAPTADICVYGYDHTQELITNGIHLADTLQSELEAKCIDLVGYSMGGLVARLAASDRPIPTLKTVITIATPNRGSLGPAQLTLLGHLALGAFRMVSPLAPRTAGVKNLSEAARIMSNRRDRLLAKYPASESPVTRLRFASVPALFYHPDREGFEFGPSISLTTLQAIFLSASLKAQLTNMERPHDGIVTEASCDLTRQDTYDWSEIHLAEPGTRGEPALCHAVLDICRDHDHGSVVGAAAQHMAELVGSLLECDDWRKLEEFRLEMKGRIRTKIP